MYISIIILFLVLITVYLSFDNLNLFKPGVSKFNLNHEENNHNAIIEFLTQHVQRVEKDYSRPPGSFSGSRYNVTGSIVGNTQNTKQKRLHGSGFVLVRQY